MPTNIGMTPERYRRLTELFEAACQRRVDARAAFLDEACAGDDALRVHVAGTGIRETAGCAQ